MLVEMIDPFDQPVLRGSGQSDVVPGLKVRHHVKKVKEIMKVKLPASVAPCCTDLRPLHEDILVHPKIEEH